MRSIPDSPACGFGLEPTAICSAAAISNRDAGVLFRGARVHVASAGGVLAIPLPHLPPPSRGRSESGSGCPPEAPGSSLALPVGGDLAADGQRHPAARAVEPQDGSRSVRHGPQGDTLRQLPRPEGFIQVRRTVSVLLPGALPPAADVGALSLHPIKSNPRLQYPWFLRYPPKLPPQTPAVPQTRSATTSLGNLGGEAATLF